jgi:hypothetical protein
MIMNEQSRKNNCTYLWSVLGNKLGPLHVGLSGLSGGTSGKVPQSKQTTVADLPSIVLKLIL